MVADVRSPRRISAALLAGLVALAACKSPEQKLLDRRQELRAMLDGLDARYAASAAAAEPRAAPDGEGAPSPGAGLVRRLADELDRSQLEGYCLAYGRGERAFALSSRVEAFVREDENAETCRKAAKLEVEIAALEREVASGRGSTPR